MIGNEVRLVRGLDFLNQVLVNLCAIHLPHHEVKIRDGLSRAVQAFKMSLVRLRFASALTLALASTIILVAFVDVRSVPHALFAGRDFILKVLALQFGSLRPR